MTGPPRVLLHHGDKRVEIEGHSIKLTGREVDALSFLLARSGELVSRLTLEREVWGFRAGVRSEVVPVTMRRLRRKLGPRAQEVLETVRGVGWRLHAPEDPNAGLPVYTTGFHPMPEDRVRVTCWLAEERSLITVVGPGGAGKTRLTVEIARQHRGEVVWTHVGAATEDSEVLTALLASAGVQTPDIEGLRASLASRPSCLVVLDGAEGAIDAVRRLADQLPEISVLVTSRRELGLPHEAAHEIGGLTGDAGDLFQFRRFDGEPGGPALASLLRAEATLARARSAGDEPRMLRQVIEENRPHGDANSPIELRLMFSNLEERLNKLMT